MVIAHQQHFSCLGWIILIPCAYADRRRRHIPHACSRHIPFLCSFYHRVSAFHSFQSLSMTVRLLRTIASFHGRLRRSRLAQPSLATLPPPNASTRLRAPKSFITICAITLYFVYLFLDFLLVRLVCTLPLRFYLTTLVYDSLDFGSSIMTLIPFSQSTGLGFRRYILDEG